MKRSELRAEKRKKRRWLCIPLIGIGIIFLALIAWGTYIFMEARNTVNEKMYTEIDSIDRDLSKKKVKAKDNLNILMLGIDSTTGDAGRSDSLIIVNLRPQEDKMKMISIPRDTRKIGRASCRERE